MDVAINLQKISIGEERMIFKPIGLIKGIYDEENGVFTDEYGYEYNMMEEGLLDFERYFCSPTTINKLREVYSEKLQDDEILGEFLAEYMEICYIGIYDLVEDKTKVVKINFEDIENSLSNIGDDCTKDTVEIDDENNPKFTFDLNTLESLKKYENIEDIREYIDELIEVSEYYSVVSARIISNVQTDMNSSNEENKRNFKLKKEESSKFNLKNIRGIVLSDIIEQDKAVYDITREILINETSLNPGNKSHILVTGPSGTGKTEIVKIICKILNKPYFIADATAYTKEGYVGKSVYSMLLGLIDAANGDIEKAQNGILVIDEIDKKLSGSNDDVSGLAVLQSLLKIADRGIIELDKGNPGYRSSILFDTSNLTIVFMGAFEKIYDKKLSKNKNIIGFNSENNVITKKDIIKEGFPAELLGRIGDVTSTYAFDENALVKLLTKSKISALLIIKEYLKESFGIDLKYTTGYVREIAKQAVKSGTNARELKPLVRESIKQALEEVFNGRRAKVLKLTKETALNNRKYYFE